MRDFTNDLRWLAINSATIKSWPLQQQIEGCARAGITGIAPWRDGVAALGPKRSRELLRAHDMTATCYCRGGMFTAAEVGARCLVLVAGGLPPGSKDIAGARAQVRDGIAAIASHARAARMPLAI